MTRTEHSYVARLIERATAECTATALHQDRESTIHRLFDAVMVLTAPWAAQRHVHDAINDITRKETP